MRKYGYLSLLAVLLLSTAMSAQLAMTRSTFTGTYTPIAMPAATLSTATGDDAAQSAIPIGFTFDYLGTSYTSIGVNTNGVASFDATMSTSGTNNNLFATNAPLLALAPWWDNIWSDTVLYQLQGSPGSQTFTIQWTNSLSYFNTATQRLNFQVILYETTNVIEFRYGNLVAGTAAANESASIGLKGATGGPGNYLDAVTGSAFTSNGMLNAATQWPSHHFRFTPGAPSPVPAGTYTVGNAGTYFNLSEAIADLNHRGISGAVTLSLIDANYDVTPANGDNFFPMLLGPVAGSSSTNTIDILPASGTATISSDGTANGNCGNAAANNVISNTNEPVFALVGANYVSVQHINISSSATGVVDRGISVLNSSATAGSQHNMFQNISVTLNRSNTGCYGISQQAITTPTAASGANSNNSYYNLTISNVYTGIYLNGNANFPDLNCLIGTSSPSLFNAIGSATANDIGAGTGNTASYGVRANNQSGVVINNCEVQNVTHSGTSTVEGIVLDAGQGNNLIYMNKVHGIYFTGNAGTANVTGIRANLSNNGTNTVKVYNNFVYDIASSYTGAASATRAVRGIYLQSLGGGGNTDTLYVDNNNVRIDNSSAPNLSSVCLEIGNANGPINIIRNNVLANFTGAQTGNAVHFAIASSVNNQVGTGASLSNYNDLYIDNANNGHTGIGQATTYTSLANWQAAMTQDANSVASDPAFNSATDLHVSSPALNAAATAVSWVTTDIDNQARLATPDIGADEFTPLLLDAGATALVAPVAGNCYGNSEQVIVRIKNFASVGLDFNIDPLTVTVNVTGAVTQTLSVMLSNNILNAGNPVASGATLDVPVGTLNMSASGTYVFNASTSVSGDGNALNDAMSAVSIGNLPGTISASPASVCAGGSVTLTLSGSSSTSNIQWQSSTDGGNTWQNETGTGFDSAVYVATPGTNTLYQAVVCGTLITNTDTVNYFSLSGPTVADDTLCGPGVINLTASGPGTISWYDAATAGNLLATGNTYSPSVSANTTFYVTNTSGNITGSVGLFDNSAGGGMSGSNNNLIFDVNQVCTLAGVYVYPAAAGNVIIDLADNTNTVINSVTFAVTAADIGQKTYVPLGFQLTPSTGMQLIRNFASVQCWRNNVGVTYPYQIPGVLSITSSTAGAGFYYFFYDWQINYGCESARVPLNVVVTPSPSITLAATSLSLCLGDSATLSVSSSNAGYAYTWTPAGTLNTGSGASVVATPVATTTYTVNASDAATGCQAVDSVLVTVNQVAPVVFNADTLICSGQTDTITVQFALGLPDNSAGGNMSASNNNLIFDVYRNSTLKGVYVYPAAAGNVVVDLLDNTNAVINTATVAVSAADVGLKTFIPLNFALTPATGMQLVRNAASVQCWRNNAGVNYPYDLPGIMSITTSTAGAGFYYFFYDWRVAPADYVYSWSSVPSGYTGNTDSAFVSPTVTTQYIVMVTDTVSGCSQQFSQTINIAGALSGTISGPASICLGDSATLVVAGSGGDGTYLYNWSNSLGTNDSVVVAPSVTTVYSDTITDGCGSIAVANFTLVVATAAPTGTFTSAATGVNTFTFTDNTTGSTSYFWDFGDGNNSTTQNPTHNYAAQGSYTVTLIATNGCGSDTITQVVLVDGIFENAQLQLFTLSPNPAHDQVQIQVAVAHAGAVMLQFYDITGRSLRSEKLVCSKGENQFNLNLQSMPQGVYMLRMQYEGQVSVVKLVVE